VVGTGAEQPVDGPFDEAQEVDAAVEDGRHVRTQVAPGETQGDDEGGDGPEEAHQI
jgi:hypothetical protein